MVNPLFVSSCFFMLLAATAIVKHTQDAEGGMTSHAQRSWVPDVGTDRETSRAKRSDDGGPLEAVVMQLSQELTLVKAQLASQKAQLASQETQHSQELASLKTQLSAMTDSVGKRGSTFVRWGRTQCPSGTTTLYSGFAGGSDVRDLGSGNNRLCLSPQPVFDETAVLTSHAAVTGAQYYIDGHLNTDVLCVLCHTSLSATFMVPGTNRCPTDSTLQYNGHLTAAKKGFESQADHVCLDANPEEAGNSTDQRPSGFFEHAVTVCDGSLTCPPYQDKKVLLCAVCSM